MFQSVPVPPIIPARFTKQLVVSSYHLLALQSSFLNYVFTKIN